MRAVQWLILLVCTLFQERAGGGDPDAVIKDFKVAYAKAGQDAGARVTAVRSLAAAPHSKTLFVLRQLIGGDESGREAIEVRVAAAETVAKFTELKGASQALLPWAKQRDRKLSDLRRASVRGLGELKSPEALDTLHKLYWEKPFELAKDAVEATVKLRDRRSIPALVKLLREAERVPDEGLGEVFVDLPIGGLSLGGAVWDDARQEMAERNRVLHAPVLAALAGFTGQDFKTYKEWNTWWHRNSSSFQLPK